LGLVPWPVNGLEDAEKTAILAERATPPGAEDFAARGGLA